ncbi:hypothetical protein [Haloglomus halophilum]|nr:hypothetical protein [Haloglomus halophilum]
MAGSEQSGANPGDRTPTANASPWHGERERHVSEWAVLFRTAPRER